MPWDSQFAARTVAMQRSTIREILKLTAQPDIISFAGGLPAPECFPVEHIQAATDAVIAERGREALQYSTTEGMPELRDFIAQRMSKNGLSITKEQVLIVSGSQQALDLMGRILLDENDRVMVENPTYLGMLLAWKPYNVQFNALPTDHDGLILDDLPLLLEQHPKLLYTIPNFHNPAGITLSLERRHALMELAGAYELPIVEDDAYGELRYSGQPLPSLLSLNAGRGHVIYLGTFSKVLAPGFRVGWVVAHEAVLEKLIQAKQSADLHTSSFNQMVVYAAAKDGFLDEHIAKLRKVYAHRRDVMLEALARHFPAECSWSKPDGGLFLMVHLPEHLNAAELLREAVEYKVAFIPGVDFFVGKLGWNTMRLNFSNAQPDRIEDGICRLGTLLKQKLAR